MKLGVLRLLGSKIPQLLVVLCARGLARFGSVENTLKALNLRILHMGRLIKASLSQPGYVHDFRLGEMGAPSQPQRRLTRRRWTPRR